jgi:hypothetical protein
MKFIFLLILLLLVFQNATKSQTDNNNSFVPDRPGMATPPDILTMGFLQVESGFQYDKYVFGNYQNRNFLFPSILVRYGIQNNVEVRIQTDYVFNIVTDSLVTSSVNGINPITIGTKIKFIEQQNLIPNISFLLNLTLPYTGKKDFRIENFAPSLCLLFSNSLSDNLNVCYNYGISWDGTTSEPAQFYALCLGANLNANWCTFIEGYGFTDQESNSNFYSDAGFAYLINDHLQIDLSGAKSIDSSSDYYCFSTGITWKF